MDVIALLHRLAEWLVPARAASLALLLAVFATLLPGVRRRRVVPADGTGRALLALGALPALAPWPWWLNLALAIAVLALALLQLRGAPPDEPWGEASSSGVPALAAVGAATALMVLFLVPGLGTYSGTPLLWEREVADGFATAFRSRVASLAYLGRCLLWTNGVVSEGHVSLLYGGPTYPLLLHAGFSSWTLRAIACVCGLLSTPLLYLLVRRWLDRPAAALATAAWAISSAVLLYARYGTSLSATLATLLLAALAVEAVRARGARAWWPAPLAAVALAVASLHYSPARLVVLLLLVVAAGHLLRSVDRLTRSAAAGAVLAVAVLAAFVAVQVRQGRAGVFLYAYGEQIFGILADRGDAAAYLGRPPRVGPATPSDGVALAAALVRHNLPDLGRLAGVVAHAGPPTNPGSWALGEDPPQIPLYFVPLLPFLALGAALSLRRWRVWPHWLLLAWSGVTVGAAMLSNRVDHHRLVTLCVPVCVWLGAGLWQGVVILRRSGLPRAAGVALVGALLGAVLLDSVWLLNEPRPVGPAPLAVTAERALAGIDGEVTAALTGDVRDRAAVELILIERERVLGVDQGQPLDRRLLRLLLDPRQRARDGETLARGLAETASYGTILLGPADDTLPLAGLLEARGCLVRRVAGPADLFVVTAPAGVVRAP